MKVSRQEASVLKHTASLIDLQAQSKENRNLVNTANSAVFSIF